LNLKKGFFFSGTILFKLIYMTQIAETLMNEQITSILIDCGSLSTTIESKISKLKIQTYA